MKSIRCTLKKGSAILALTLLVAFSLKACNKEEIPIGSITMITSASQVRLIIETTKSSDNLTIDWGDGKESNLNDAILDGISDWLYFSHEYSGTTERTIVITGHITMLNCRNMQINNLDLTKVEMLEDLDCSNNLLTTLDVSRNTVLKILECDYNQLKILEVNKNTSLYRLSCVANQLTAPALNDLFRALPYYRGLEHNEVGNIYISHRNPGPADNPGIFDCDPSIAEEKGWIFRTLR